MQLPDQNLESGTKGDDVLRLHRVLEAFELVTFEEAETEQDVDPVIAAAQPLSVADAPDVFSDTTVEAVKLLQSRFDLEETGRFDEGTFGVLKGISCFSTRAPFKDFLSEPDTSFTYSILNFPAGMTESRVTAAVSQAFAYWASGTPLSFSRVADGNADMTVRFISLDGAEGVLGNALIELDDDERWRIGAEKENVGGASYDLISILAHEIGHKLGLSHVAESSSIMRMSLGHSSEHRQLRDFDRSLIQEIHGSPEIIERPSVHGNTTRAEHPDRLLLARPTGPAGVFIGEQGAKTWLHIAPPLPGSHTRPARIHRIRLKAIMFPGVTLNEIHIWDGNTLLEKHVLEDGSVQRAERVYLLGVASKRRLTEAPEISIGVTYDQGGPDHDRRIDIVSAGVDLLEAPLRGPVLEPV